MQTTALPFKEGENCVSGTGFHGGGFALIVVLFILLIIIGASWL
ncbi:YjcZ family sporulation protein [Neobacillus niacini]